jgi:hypothetical protein
MRKLLIGVLMMSVAAWAVFGQQGIIKEVFGTVELKHAGSDVFVAAAVGDMVAEQTLVSTGFKSQALITVGNSTIAVQPLTRLSLTEIATIQGGERVNVNLSTGRVRANVTPPMGGQTEFTVASPMATASVRGTVFEFDTINLRVNEGTVAYSGSRGRPMLVGAGNTSTVNPVTGRAVDPIVVAGAELLPPAPVGSSNENRPVKGPVAVSPEAAVSSEAAVSPEVEFTLITGY